MSSITLEGLKEAIHARFEAIRERRRVPFLNFPFDEPADVGAPWNSPPLVMADLVGRLAWQEATFVATAFPGRPDGFHKGSDLILSLYRPTSGAPSGLLEEVPARCSDAFQAWLTAETGALFRRAAAVPIRRLVEFLRSTEAAHAEAEAEVEAEAEMVDDFHAVVPFEWALRSVAARNVTPIGGRCRVHKEHLLPLVAKRLAERLLLAHLPDPLTRRRHPVDVRLRPFAGLVRTLYGLRPGDIRRDRLRWDRARAAFVPASGTPVEVPVRLEPLIGHPPFTVVLPEYAQRLPHCVQVLLAAGHLTHPLRRVLVNVLSRINLPTEVLLAHWKPAFLERYRARYRDRRGGGWHEAREEWRSVERAARQLARSRSRAAYRCSTMIRLGAGAVSLAPASVAEEGGSLGCALCCGSSVCLQRLGLPLVQGSRLNSPAERALAALDPENLF